MMNSSKKVKQWKPFIDFLEANPLQLTPLTLLVDFCKADPSILNDPLFSFFREYLESLNAKLPPSAHGETKPAKKHDQFSSTSSGMPGGFPGGGMPSATPEGMPGNVDFRGMMNAEYMEAKKEVAAKLGWMPKDVDISKVMNDPELMAAFSDPETMAALQAVSNSLGAAMTGRNQANPEVVSIIAKMMSK